MHKKGEKSFCWFNKITSDLWKLSFHKFFSSSKSLCRTTVSLTNSTSSWPFTEFPLIRILSRALQASLWVTRRNTKPRLPFCCNSPLISSRYFSKVSSTVPSNWTHLPEDRLSYFSCFSPYWWILFCSLFQRAAYPSPNRIVSIIPYCQLLREGIVSMRFRISAIFSCWGCSARIIPCFMKRFCFQLHCISIPESAETVWIVCSNSAFFSSKAFIESGEMNCSASGNLTFSSLSSSKEISLWFWRRIWYSSSVKGKVSVFFKGSGKWNTCSSSFASFLPNSSREYTSPWYTISLLCWLRRRKIFIRPSSSSWIKDFLWSFNSCISFCNSVGRIRETPFWIFWMESIIFDWLSPKKGIHNGCSRLSSLSRNTVSAFTFSLVTKTVFPWANKFPKRLAMVWVLPVPGGPCTSTAFLWAISWAIKSCSRLAGFVIRISSSSPLIAFSLLPISWLLSESPEIGVLFDTVSWGFMISMRCGFIFPFLSTSSIILFKKAAIPLFWLLYKIRGE